MSAPLQIGIVLFPRVTQLDFTGPLQVFSSVPGAKVHLIWKRIEPVPSDSVMAITPTMTFADCPQLDVLCVPDMKMPAESYQQMTAAMLKSLDDVKGWLTAE